MSSTKGFSRPLLLILSAQAIAFAFFIPRIGFYHDDWANLERCFRAGGFWDGVRLYWPAVRERPLDGVYYPALFALGELQPLAYQSIFYLFDALQGVLLFLFLEGLLGARAPALAAAVITVLLPNHSATHHWLGASAQTLCIDLVLMSLIIDLKSLGGRRLALAASLTLYATSLLIYEAQAFFPVMLAAGLAVRARKTGASLPASAAKGLRVLAPYGAVLATALLWQRAALPLLYHHDNPRALAFSMSHGLYAFFVGAECLSNRLLMLCLRGVKAAIQEFGAWAWLAAAAAAGLSYALSSDDRQEQGRDDSQATALAAALAAFVAGYAPYALSAAYVPSIVGIMSRTSAGGAIAGSIAAAAALGAAAKAFPKARLARGAALAATLGAFILADWHQARLWERSWLIQQDILAKIKSKAAVLPPSAMVLLGGFSRYVDDDLSGAIIFDAHYDFSAALRLTTGRKDLGGNVLSPRLRLGRDGLVQEDGENSYYQNLFLYDYHHDAMVALAAKPQNSKISP